MPRTDLPQPIAHFADRALTPASPSSAPPSAPKPRRKVVPPRVGKIVGELGLRFRPAANADLEAHAETIRLLAEDLADVPISLLEAAAGRWATTKPFLPRASELIDLAGEIGASMVRGTQAATDQLQAHCDRLNARDTVNFWFVAGTAPDRRVESRPR